MGKELEYFKVGSAYGGCQDWFSDYMMRIGGCGAVTACDSCIYFDLYMGTQLYPYDVNRLTRADYIRFGMEMKPYLRPRWSGIDTLQLFMEGFGDYLSGRGCTGIGMEPFRGNEPVERAREAIIRQINRCFPVPCLILNHKDPGYKAFEWHWFLLTGYERFVDECMVKVVTYGTWHWLDLRGLWNTGHRRKGGLILYHSQT